MTGGSGTNAGTSPDEASGDDGPTAPGAAGASEQEGEAAEAAENEGGGGTVRFHPEATEGGKGTGRRRRVQEDAVANMGFVELVENLLLAHDSSNRRNFRSSSLGSILTEASSEPDSDADSVYMRAEQVGQAKAQHVYILACPRQAPLQVLLGNFLGGSQATRVYTKMPNAISVHARDCLCMHFTSSSLLNK